MEGGTKALWLCCASLVLQHRSSARDRHVRSLCIPTESRKRRLPEATMQAESEQFLQEQICLLIKSFQGSPGPYGTVNLWYIISAARKDRMQKRGSCRLQGIFRGKGLVFRACGQTLNSSGALVTQPLHKDPINTRAVRYHVTVLPHPCMTKASPTALPHLPERTEVDNFIGVIQFLMPMFLVLGSAP